MEHGKIGHRNVYDEEIHVSLIFKFPNYLYEEKRVKIQVRNIDIFPTILDMLGIGLKDIKIDGISLIPLINGKFKERNDLYAYNIGLSEKHLNVSIRTGRGQKLVCDRKMKKCKLYNCNEVGKKKLKHLKEKLNMWLKVNFNMFESKEKHIYKDTVKELKSLGYIE